MEITKWLEEQKKKYKIAIADYEDKLDYAISHENPDGIERHASALIKARWYVAEVIPMIEEHLPNKPKK